MLGASDQGPWPRHPHLSQTDLSVDRRPGAACKLCCQEQVWPLGRGQPCLVIRTVTGSAQDL